MGWWTTWATRIFVELVVWNLCAWKDSRVPRCCFPVYEVNNVVEKHIFFDGIELAYWAVAYLRFLSASGYHVSFVMSKVRLTPLKRDSLKTTPWIELNAAIVGIEFFQKLLRELEYKVGRVVLWSDSLIVLSYIASDNRRFRRFVSNRFAYIRSKTTPVELRYVPNSENPCRRAKSWFVWRICLC